MLKKLLLPITSYKFLLYQLTLREIKARYKQSFVGYAWVVVNPLSQILIYTFVFSVVLRFPQSDPPYIIFLCAGLLPWSFLAASISQASQSLVEHASLLRKVAFPREVIPYSVVAAKLVDLFISAIIFFILAIILKTRIAPTAPIFLLLFGLQVILTTGISLFLSAANLFYRDIAHLTTLLLTIWMYLTPVVYSVSMVPQGIAWIYRLNPMVGIIEGYRSALFGLPFEPKAILWATVSSIVVFVLGFYFFKRSERVFADIV